MGKHPEATACQRAIYTVQDGRYPVASTHLLAAAARLSHCRSSLATIPLRSSSSFLKAAIWRKQRSHRSQSRVFGWLRGGGRIVWARVSGDPSRPKTWIRNCDEAAPPLGPTPTSVGSVVQMDAQIRKLKFFTLSKPLGRQGKILVDKEFWSCRYFGSTGLQHMCIAAAAAETVAQSASPQQVAFRLW